MRKHAVPVTAATLALGWCLAQALESGYLAAAVGIATLAGSTTSPSPTAQPATGKPHYFYSHFVGDMGWAGIVLWALVLIVFALFFGLPMLWLLIAPSKNDAELLGLYPLAFGSLARYLEAFQNLRVFNNGQVLMWAYNSLYYVITSLVLSLVITVPAGYILAVARFPGRTAVLWATLITMMLPGSALVLPLFLEMSLFRLVNTPWSVILPAIFFPFGVYLTFIYFATARRSARLFITTITTSCLKG